MVKWRPICLDDLHLADSIKKSISILVKKGHCCINMIQGRIFYSPKVLVFNWNLKLLFANWHSSLLNPENLLSNDFILGVMACWLFAFLTLLIAVSHWDGIELPPCQTATSNDVESTRIGYVLDESWVWNVTHPFTFSLSSGFIKRQGQWNLWCQGTI